MDVLLTGRLFQDNTGNLLRNSGNNVIISFKENQR